MNQNLTQTKTWIYSCPSVAVAGANRLVCEYSYLPQAQHFRSQRARFVDGDPVAQALVSLVLTHVQTEMLVGCSGFGTLVAGVAHRYLVGGIARDAPAHRYLVGGDIAVDKVQVGDVGYPGVHALGGSTAANILAAADDEYPSLALGLCEQWDLCDCCPEYVLSQTCPRRSFVRYQKVRWVCCFCSR